MREIFCIFIGFATGLVAAMFMDIMDGSLAQMCYEGRKSEQAMITRQFEQLERVRPLLGLKRTCVDGPLYRTLDGNVRDCTTEKLVEPKTR